MTRITVELADEQATKLKEKAQQLGVNIEEFARIAMESYKRNEVDEDIEPEDPRFEKAADRILKKNAELYKRLA